MRRGLTEKTHPGTPKTVTLSRDDGETRHKFGIWGIILYRIIPDQQWSSAVMQANYLLPGYWASRIFVFTLYYAIHWAEYRQPEPL